MATRRTTVRSGVTNDDWDRQWARNWSKVGTAGYELPRDPSGGDERDFLTSARTPAGERIPLGERRACLFEDRRGFAGFEHDESHLQRR